MGTSTVPRTLALPSNFRPLGHSRCWRRFRPCLTDRCCKRRMAPFMESHNLAVHTPRERSTGSLGLWLRLSTTSTARMAHTQLADWQREQTATYTAPPPPEEPQMAV